MTDVPLKSKPANYQCPYCLKPVGLLGRGLAWFLGTQIHQCDFSNVKDKTMANDTLGLPYPKPPKQDLPFWYSDIKRALILIRTSNNAHGWVNCEILSEKVDGLPDVAKAELAQMLRNIADGLSPKHEACPDCGRQKAKSADDAAAGMCPKWWAIRDQAAEDDCKSFQNIAKDAVSEPMSTGETEADHVVRLLREAGQSTSPLQHVEGVPQLGGKPEDLRNTLCAVIEIFGVDGAQKVTEYALNHRGTNAFDGTPAPQAHLVGSDFRKEHAQLARTLGLLALNAADDDLRPALRELSDRAFRTLAGKNPSPLSSVEASPSPQTREVVESNDLPPPNRNHSFNGGKDDWPREVQKAPPEKREVDSFGNDLVERELVSIILRMSRHLQSVLTPAARKLDAGALDYLRRKGLMPSPLRAEETVVQSGDDQRPDDAEQNAGPAQGDNNEH